MKKIFLVLGLFSGLTAFAQEKTFVQVNRPNYSLSYPITWSVDTSKMLGTDIIIRSPRTDSLDQFMENLNVFVQDLSGQNYDLLKMARESELQLKNLVTDMEILESRLDSSESKQFYHMKYRGRQGKFILITEQRYYLINDIAFALTFTTQDGKENDFGTLSTAIFKSFRSL